MGQTYPILETLRGELIVSCQAGPDEPLHGAIYMAAMARAAELGGAGGIRANGPQDIAAIRSTVSLPIIGISKQQYAGYDVFITPTFGDAKAAVQAGAELVALDGTFLPRPDQVVLKDLVSRIHEELNVPVLADVSCSEDGLHAQEAGVDGLMTTLAGYTRHGRPPQEGPDLEFVTELVGWSRLPVIAEGRFQEPWQVADAFVRGAFAVVVGGAITRPQDITRRFADAALVASTASATPRQYTVSDDQPQSRRRLLQ